MTTMEHFASLAARVEANAAARPPIDWRRFFIALLSAVPYLLGKWVGHVVYCVRIVAAASREGYHASAAPAAARRPLVSTMDR